ncbi:transglutaminase family protein [Granulosicoccus antarcticus]|uniref:Protein-glutamine gamma-glutamyltransferase n=1 Tax=Granulosicoccus antarcticus IMCC3135 TaxID=1192854 RepID=A0A2Z2NPW6_9GAMM|nr:transglutaminase family protein [Granulosicoccus antarcticus]ASJ72505.1 Protein-glutamine gamma-glutamyltransferase [Granulosicoccus antarcticus IMCC3135]
MKLQVRHRTYYKYTGLASLSHNHVCLQPRSTDTQTCLETRVDVTPEPGTVQYDVDVYGNTTARFSLSQRHQSCDIIVTSLIETSDEQAPLPSSHSVTDNLQLLKSQSTSDAMMAQDCRLPSPYIPNSDTLEEFIKELPLHDQSVLEYGQQMMEHIFDTFEYSSGFSNLVTPLSTIHAARKGVCQDFAHLAIGALRLQGIPARYVSGYLETLPPPGQKKLQGADASHAWFAIYDAEHGWIDFDPTNNKRPDRQYITTAWGRDYGDVTPVKGMVYGGGGHSLTVEVDVTRMEEYVLTSAEN